MSGSEKLSGIVELPALLAAEAQGQKTILAQEPDRADDAVGDGPLRGNSRRKNLCAPWTNGWASDFARYYPFSPQKREFCFPFCRFLDAAAIWVVMRAAKRRQGDAKAVTRGQLRAAQKRAVFR